MIPEFSAITGALAGPIETILASGTAFVPYRKCLHTLIFRDEQVHQKILL